MPIIPQIGARKYSKYVSKKLSKGLFTWKDQKYTKRSPWGLYPQEDPLLLFVSTYSVHLHPNAQHALYRGASFL